MSYYSEQALQEKLNRLSASQDSIETLSTWIVHHKTHATTSISIWLKNYIDGDADRRLLLFYLANDVLQNSRRKGVDAFMELFRAPLEQAANLASGLKIQTSVERIFRIWKERHVFESSFLKQLQGAIEPSRTTASHDKKHVTLNNKEKMDFKLPLLEDAILEMQKFEGEMKVKSTLLTNLRIDVSDTACFSQLKDKSAGDKFKAEFEEASQKLQEFAECLNIEANERRNIVEMLHLCQLYQEEKMTELNSVLQDYSQLQVHLESLKGKLKDRVEELDRAQHTATSDPTSKDDITVAGDMEIDSDNEAQSEAAPTAMDVKSSEPQTAIPVTGVTLPPVLQPPPNPASSCPFIVPSASQQTSFIPSFAPPPVRNQPPILPPIQPQFMTRPMFPSIPPNLSPSLLGRPPLGGMHSHTQALPSSPLTSIPPASTRPPLGVPPPNAQPLPSSSLPSMLSDSSQPPLGLLPPHSQPLPSSSLPNIPPASTRPPLGVPPPLSQPVPSSPLPNVVTPSTHPPIILPPHSQPLPSSSLSNMPPSISTTHCVSAPPPLPSMTRPMAPRMPPVSQPVFPPPRAPVAAPLLSPHLAPSSLAADMPPPLATRPPLVDITALPPPVAVSAGNYCIKQVTANNDGISQQTESQLLQQEVQLAKFEEEIKSPPLTQNLFPKSLLQDYYSDSESEEEDNDGSQPYSPSQVLVISTPTQEHESSESPPTSTQVSTPISTPCVVDSTSPTCINNDTSNDNKKFTSASIASSLEMILGSVAKTSVASHQPSSSEELNRFPTSGQGVSRDGMSTQPPSVQSYNQFSSGQDAIATTTGQQLPTVSCPQPSPGTSNVPLSEESKWFDPNARASVKDDEPKWFNPDAFAESHVPSSHGVHPMPNENTIATTPSQQPSSFAPPSSVAAGASQNVAGSPLSVSPGKVELAKINPENIKITPSLTSLLDNLFPKLSKSLEERKRKSRDDSNPDIDSKAPRMNNDGPAVETKASNSIDVCTPPLVSGSVAPSQQEPSVQNAVASPIPTIGSRTPSRVAEFQRHSTQSRPIPSVPPLIPGFRPDLPSPGPILAGPPLEFPPPPPSSGINFPFGPRLPGPGIPQAQAQFSPGPPPDFGMVPQLNNSPFPRKPFEPFPSPYNPGLDTQAMIPPQNFGVRPPPPHLRFPGRFRSPSQRPRYF